MQNPDMQRRSQAFAVTQQICQQQQPNHKPGTKATTS
jgi:hypothetical protein